MAYQPVDIGAAPNDGTGDPIRDAFDKCNDNFVELYAGLVGLLDFKGSTNCSANPNYPAASKGDFYLVSVAGKIGGASGVTVEVADSYFAIADNAGGTQAAVGTSWTVIQGNVISFSGGVDVEDEGTPESTGATTLNFTGTGVSAADMGGGVTDITIPGGISTFALGDATDVDTTGAASGNVLTYDGAQWEPVAPSAAALSSLYEDQKAANTSGGTSTSALWIARTLNTEVYDDIGLALHASTVTISNASPGVVTWTAHGLIANSAVIFTTTGGLPTGLTAGTTYYVIAAGLAANTFQVSATAGGAAINTSSAGSGTHTATASAISLAAGTYEVDAVSNFYRCVAARIRIQDITNTATLALGDNGYSSSADNVHTKSSMLRRFTLAGTALVQLEYRVGSGLATFGLGVESNISVVEIYSRLKLTKLS